MFRRKPTETFDLGLMLGQGQDMIEQVGQVHRQWGLGTADRWDIDPQAATITWTFADGRSAVAPVQAIGSFRDGPEPSWQWAWATTGLPEQLRVASEKVRAAGEKHGHPSLTTPHFECDATNADELAAIAFRITDATGFYCGRGKMSLYVSFGDVELIAADGQVSYVRIKVDD